MKKIYRVEGENNYSGPILDTENYNDAIEMIEQILHDESNYHYECNKDNRYLLCEVSVINESEDEYEEEYVDTLLSVSVREYLNMSYEDKKEKFKRK